MRQERTRARLGYPGSPETSTGHTAPRRSVAWRCPVCGLVVHSTPGAGIDHLCPRTPYPHRTVRFVEDTHGDDLVMFTCSADDLPPSDG